MTIHYLNEDDAKQAEIKQDLIDGLEELLEQARTGELISLVGMGHRKDNTLMTAQIGLWNYRVYETAGMLEALKLRCLIFDEEAVGNAVKQASEQ